MVTVKQQIQQFIDQLPDDLTWEDVQYHLYVRQKVVHSLQTAEREGTLTHEQVEAEMREWLKQYGGRR